MVGSLVSLFASILVCEAGEKGPASGCVTLGSSSGGPWSCWIGLWGLKTLSFLPKMLFWNTSSVLYFFSDFFFVNMYIYP